MSNCKKKKYFVLTLQFPLYLIGLVIKLIVAFLSFFYYRWIAPGVHQGYKFHNWLGSQEQGFRRPKDCKGSYWSNH